MDNVGSLSTIKPDKMDKRSKLLQRIKPAAVESHGTECETRIRDAFAMAVNTRSYNHVIPGLTGGDGEFETMGNEIPIFRDEEHQLSAPNGIDSPRGI
jgi:hypothetical protein